MESCDTSFETRFANGERVLYVPRGPLISVVNTLNREGVQNFGLDVQKRIKYVMRFCSDSDLQMWRDATSPQFLQISIIDTRNVGGVENVQKIVIPFSDPKF